MRQRARAEQVKGQYEDLIKGQPPPPSGNSTAASDVKSTEERHINFFADMKTGV